MKTVKLHPALKDPEMKYPRLANALLDVGMALIFLSSIGLIFVIFYRGVGQYYRGVGQYLIWGFMALIAGALFVAGAQKVSKLRRQKSIDEGRPTLRRVK